MSNCLIDSGYFFSFFGVYYFKEIVQGAITNFSIFKYIERVKSLLFV